MNRFESTPDPLEERLSDEELREVLRVLGDAELGGDERATVGAVVEATGADAATVLRILGEIRYRAIQSQQAALEAVERRVARLERRPIEEKPTYAQHQAADKVVDPEQKLLNAVLGLACGLLVTLMAWSSISGQNETQRPSPGWSSSTEVSDGTLTIDSNYNVEVVRKDGTKRRPTPDEEAMMISLAAPRK